MTEDKNKGITSITYNHLNLPAKVVFSPSGGGQGEDDRIEYLYDAAGIKLKQTVYEGGVAVKTTDYIGEFIYEDQHDGNGRELQLIQHEEGRIIPLEPSHPEFISGTKEHDYQYHLKDHLGNVRVTFSTTPESYVTIQNMESLNDNGSDPEDPTMFVNIPYRQDAIINTTTGGDEVATLNAGETGVMIFMEVNKGDQVDFAVNANYQDAGNSYDLTSLVASTILSGYNNYLPTGGIEIPSSASTDIGSGINEMINGAGGKSSNSVAPQAFINYICFNKEMEFVNAGFTQISSVANSTNTSETITLDAGTLEADGFILAYLTNETTQSIAVNFDDFIVNHTKTNVVSTQDYYPFGLTFNESVRVASVKNRMNTFQDQEYEEETGWVKFKWRNHQPDIGRFFNVDPLAEDYVHNSVYAFSENKLTGHVELEGLEAVVALDTENNPNNKRVYTGKKYVIQENGEVNGPYTSSTHPNNTDFNTVSEGIHQYNNESGHSGGTKKGLNIVDENGSRTNTPGTDAEGNEVTMEYVNDHSGVKPEDNNGLDNRGSAGCPTTCPSEVDDFNSNFDWSGSNGTTGNSSGSYIILRGNEAQEMDEFLDNRTQQIVPSVDSSLEGYTSAGGGGG